MRGLIPSRFLKASIILQMQASRCAIICWSPTEVYDTILLSGVQQISGKYFNFNSVLYYLTLETVLGTKKNYSIFAMHRLEM
jgi:hypothetical protein